MCGFPLHSVDEIRFCWILLLLSIRSRAAARLSLSEMAAVLLLLLLFSSLDLDAAGSDDSTGLGYSYFEMMGGVVMGHRPKKNGWIDQGFQPPNPLI